MPYVLTRPDIERFAASASEQEREELNVLLDAGKGVQARLERAGQAVRKKVGTLVDQCALFALAYLDPESLPDDPNRFVQDRKYFETEWNRILTHSEKDGILPRGADGLYTTVRTPGFFAGLAFTSEQRGKHLGLILPGIGTRMDQEPTSVADILNRIVYLSGDNSLPNFVDPASLLRRAESLDGEDEPFIVAFFDRPSKE